MPDGAFFQGPMPVWLAIIGGFISILGVGVGVWRKWRAGEIEDDGILINRLDKDNERLREQLALKDKIIASKDEVIDELRIRARRGEDAAAVYYRQLIQEGIRPKELP